MGPAFGFTNQQAHQLLITAQQQQQQMLNDSRPQSTIVISGPTARQHDLCAVCSDQAQGIHFGVVVCRACAAFFRRSTIAKRVYRCRFDGNCPIGQREVRCSCRACRLAKCLSLGMDPNAVQRHRDQIGPRKRERDSTDAAETMHESYEEELLESKPRLLARSSTEDTEPHIQVDQPKEMPTTSSSLLPPLAFTLSGAFQQAKDGKDEGRVDEQQKGESTIRPLPKQPQQQVLHVEENGKSYALLGSAPLPNAIRPGSSSTTTTSITSNNNQQQSIEVPQHLMSIGSSPNASLSDLKLRALPSAFSSIQTNLHQPDSGNVSANSSAFSSPLNPASNLAAQQNSPLNPGLSITGCAPSTSSMPFAPPAIAAGPSSTPMASLFGPTPTVTALAQQQQLLLPEMLRGYQKFLSLHKTARFLKDKKCPFQEQNEEPLKEALTEGNYAEDVESIKADLSLVSEMLDEHFFPFRTNFSAQSKWTMLRNFFCPFLLANRSRLSTQHFTGHEDARIYCASNSFVDLKHVERYFTVKQCRTDPVEIGRIFEPVFWRIQKLIRQPMGRFQFTEEEFVGLIGILFWNDRIDSLTEEERKITTQTRESIFGELYQVCRQNSGPREDAGNRFCSLLNLFHHCQKSAYEIASAFSLVNVVKKFEMDEFLHQFHPNTF